MMKDGFITPSNHVNFQAKKLFGPVGQIIDGSVAYITLKGGGPLEQHTHEHNHLFIVVKGEAVLCAYNLLFLSLWLVLHRWLKKKGTKILVSL